MQRQHYFACKIEENNEILGGTANREDVSSVDHNRTTLLRTNYGHTHAHKALEENEK
jgi:hypothetical protein